MHAAYNRFAEHVQRHPAWYSYVRPERFIDVIIDYGNGVHKVFSVEWRQGMTVLDALRQSSSRPHGLEVEVRDNGEGAFVVRIDDLVNQGAGVNRLNWLYSVDEHLSETGCGTRNLQNFDTVMWQFGPCRRFLRR